jgi:phosphomannomutase/phosphoglucomutase
MQQLEPSVFRAYDIRGIVGDTLTSTTMYLLGQAVGSMVLQHGEQSLVLGFDGRLSSPDLAVACGDGVLSTGCDVIDLAMVPTPLLYYATTVGPTSSGMMITGSHNPPEYNGCKIVVGGVTLAGEAIQDLYHKMCAGNFQCGRGSYRELDIVSSYMRQVQDTVTLARPITLVVDAGNAVAGLLVAELYRALGCHVIELFCQVDGTFPNHHPDPSKAVNLQALIAAVAEYKADIGLAFDGDGDRLGVVTNTGQIIWPDRQLILLARDILQTHSHAKIIYDIKCTKHVADVVRQYGGEPIICQTGHSFIKAKLHASGALLAGEMSGHIFFKDRWYGFDDALYAGARLLEIIASQPQDVSTLFAAIPDSINTPELIIDVPEAAKADIMAALIVHAKQQLADSTAVILTLDGLRVDLANSWGLVRPSNTMPCLILRFEADSAQQLLDIQAMFRRWLLATNPELVLPF